MHPLTSDRLTGPDINKTISAAVVMLAAIVPYINTLSNGFVFDDNHVILNNPWITDFGHLKDILFSSVWSFAEERGASDYYRPTLHLIALIEYGVFGLEPWGWHLVNIVLHALNALLVFFMAHMFFRGPGDTAQGAALPLAAGLVFALHPINTETVNFVSCLPDLLFAFFSLCSMCVYMSRPSAVLRAIAPAFLFLLALLSKETAVVVPLLLFVHDRGRGKDAPGLKAYIPFIVAFGLYMVLRTYALGGATAREAAGQGPLFTLLNMPPIFLKTLKLLLMPMNLSVFHVHEPAGALEMIFSALFTGMLIWAVLRLKRVEPETLFPASLVILPILPTLYLLFSGNVGFPAERYLYLPSAGLGMLLAQALRSMLSRLGGRRARAAILAGFLALLTMFSFKVASRNHDWKDDETLWSATLRDWPGNFFAHSELAEVYEKEGLLDKAVPHQEEAVALRPEDVHMRHKLGLLYYETGKNEDALALFNEVLEKQPSNSDALYNVGLIRMDKGEWLEAEKALTEALVYSKKDYRRIRIKNALAVVYARTGRMGAAEKELEEALEIDPSDRETLGNLSGLSRR